MPVTAAAALQRSVMLDKPVDQGITAPLLAASGPHVRAKDRPTAGKQWFDMPAQEVTPELKRELQIIRNRAFLDPKRHYKTREEREGLLPKYFQMGTVVEAAHERGSSAARLTNKQRKPTLVAALLADEDARRYFQKNYDAVTAKAVGGGVGQFRKRKMGSGPSWKRGGGGGGKRQRR
jgi:hypothetical protein